MKVTLTNFGIWKKKTFTFPDTGITLLSGPSGKGKTTILRAINYALTGEGTKLPTHGEVKCMVELDYLGLRITRTNRPSRLIVVYNQVESFDEEAQSIINQRIGKHFSVAGYIQQKGENSFLALPPAEKLRFLERVAFSDLPIDEIKEKSREQANLLELRLSRVTGELEHLQTHPVPQPSQLSDQQLALLSEEMGDRIRAKEAELTQLHQQEKAHQHFTHTQALLSNRLADLIIPVIPEPLDASKEEKLLQLWEQYNRYQQACAEKEKIEKEYLLPHQKEIDELTALLASISLSEFTDQEELDALKQALVDFSRQQEQDRIRAGYSEEQHLRLQEEVPRLRSQLASYVLGREARQCPHCRSSLRIVGNTLEVYAGGKYSLEQEKEYRTSLGEAERELTRLQGLKTKIDSFPEERIELDPTEVEARIRELESCRQKALQEQQRRSQVQTRLDSSHKNSSITKMRARLVELEKIAPVNRPEIPESLLREKVVQARDRAQQIQVRTKELEVVRAREKMLQQELVQLVPVEPVPGEKIQALEHHLESLRKQQLEQTRIKGLHLLWQQQEKDYQNYLVRLSSAQQERGEVADSFTRAKKFRDAVITAELLSIQNLIDEINTHLSYYLHLFFPEHPITIEVCLFKANEKTKTIRNQVNLSVGYHGAITELSTLSGGEKDRVNLAFTLALAEIFQLPLLILDETLSSLDRATAENVLDQISKTDRAVLIVAHQASTGLFDHLVCLEEL